MKIKRLLTAIGLMAGMVAFALPAPAQAVNVFSQCGSGGSSQVCRARNDSATSVAKNVINAMIFVVGIASVVMIIVGGFRYVMSSGDSSSVNTAKNTILYAVIGLSVAIMSFAIVNFVLDNL